jgi:hypothetical protein
LFGQRGQLAALAAPLGPLLGPLAAIALQGSGARLVAQLGFDPRRLQRQQQRPQLGD